MVTSESSLTKRIKRHVIGRRREYFAVTAPGFEKLCLRELRAFAPDASEVNERNIIAMENERLKVTFSQVAGMVARRIISYLREGDVVAQGQRYGLIKFGSRMDVVIPRSCKVLVSLKEPVRGGLTTLARMEDGR